MNTRVSLVRLGLLLSLLLLPAAPVPAAQPVEVRVSGVEGEALDNVRASLSLQRARAAATAAELRELYDRAPREITRALQPFGYYRPEVTGELREPEGETAPWQASFRIEPGEVVPVASMQVSFDGGGGDPALADIPGGLALKQGEGLDHRGYETAKRELLERVRDLGYRDASLAVHRVEVDLADYTARVILQVATGPRFVIGPIEFEQDRFEPSFLARYLLLKPGDPYTGDALAEQRQLLSRSGYFREVEVEPLPPEGSAPHAIPLRIRVVLFPANRYRGRLAWGTDTDFGAQLGWTRRYAGGRGQHLNAGVAAVEERNKFAADVNYVVPLDPLAGSKITAGARHESKDLTFEDVELNKGGETRIAANLLSATWRRPDTRWAGFEVKPEAGLSLISEDYDVFEVLFGDKTAFEKQILKQVLNRDYGPGAYDTLTPDFRGVVPSLRFLLRRGNDQLFIRDGDSLDLTLLGAAEVLGSNFNFWQARLQSWHIRSLGDRSRLLLRTRLGYSEAKSREVLGINFNEMPEYYEFRAGGALSVRGYSFESLYPEDAITGGKHELVGSVEYEYEFIPKWSAALFVDGGNAFNRWQDYDARYGVGVGLHWRSPVGLARIDLGVPLNDSDESFQVYITVGPEF